MPTIAEHSERIARDPICLACGQVSPRDVGKDGGGDGWLIGNLRRGSALFELAICPDHHLYTIGRQTGLLENERPLLVTGRREPKPLCRHCQIPFPEGKMKAKKWGVAKIERWTPEKIYLLTFPLCPDHTLTGGP